MTNQRRWPAKRTIDVQEGDDDWVEQLCHQIDMLTGMVEEAFVTSPVFLLSPVLREAVRDKGRQVAAMMQKARGRVSVDNLGKPLSEG